MYSTAEQYRKTIVKLLSRKEKFIQYGDVILIKTGDRWEIRESAINDDVPLSHPDKRNNSTAVKLVAKFPKDVFATARQTNCMELLDVLL